MVRQKYVTPGQLDGGVRVIKDGLVAADRVIVNGLMHARPSIKVKAEQAADPSAPAPAKPGDKTGDEAKSG
jgi:multidrug efflux pump subunit AcrA (membrane-fusion protein)